MDNLTLDSGGATSNRLQLDKRFMVEGINRSHIRDLVISKVSFSTFRDPIERQIMWFLEDQIDLTLCRFLSAYRNKFIKVVEKYHQYKFINRFGNLTLSEFVEMIVMKKEERYPTYNNCHYNQHWLPYIAKCGYCDFPFKIIAKLETLSQDQKFIGQLAGVEISSLRKS